MTTKDRALAEVWNSYRGSAKSRGLLFDLDLREFREMTLSKCHYCGSPPCHATQKWNVKTKQVDFYHWNGIDRVDSNEGYTMENCVPCCITCNRMKLNLDVEDFLNRVRQIYNHSIDRIATLWEEELEVMDNCGEGI